MKFADICCENDHSISPRMLCPPSVAENVRRRLDLSFSDLMDELSPVTISGGGGAVARMDVCDDDCDCASCSIGECGVCYANLPLRKNHVFTLCGHLYCLRCLLKWWDTSSTCPICRAELFEAEAGAEADAEAGAWGVVADTDTDTESDTSSVQEPDTTLMEQYLQQDPSAIWSILRLGNTDMIFDDSVIPLSQYEITELRSNREIATTLLARTNELFTGRATAAEYVVHHIHILQENWIEYFTRDTPRMLSDIDNSEIMYEFVIRKHTEISPLYETNLFGSIQEITIVLVEDAQGRDSDVYNWENLHEYAFVANVFTATTIYNGGDNHSSSLRRYGDYDMNEGTVRPVRVLIRFSQIRRLYRFEYGLEVD
jgi:hypothetical protein